ncbi:tumor necrosis factor receptor superfamily member 13B [Pitangus sulphuratus]|nr:tumor necrosis factor receptor superfamily member 13B [Pitangus sulphuratus]
MDGTRVGRDAMNNCTDQEYWDTLVSQCIPCSLVCGQPTARRCDAVCESMDCNKTPGFYYDELVRSCIECSTVCGQHPKECAPSCEPSPPSPAAVLEQKACAEQEPWLVVYLLLGLCLCALICSLLLGWTHLRRKGEVGSCHAGPGTCHCREDSAKAIPGTVTRDEKKGSQLTKFYQQLRKLNRYTSNRSPRTANRSPVDAPSLEVLKARLDGALSNLV